MINGKLKESLKLKGNKYSYNFLKLSRKQNNIYKVLLVPWDSISGHKSKKGTLYFSSDSDSFGLSGMPVHRVRIADFSQSCCISFSSIPFREIKTKDVTDWFINQYMSKGKCMFDDWSHEWVKINSHSRKCSYCNKHESREVRTIIKRERKEIWT